MVLLGQLCTKIGSGITPSGGSQVYLDEGIALVRSQNVCDLNFIIDGLAYINQVTADLMKNVELKKNDILLNITGDSVARICMVPDEILPARVNQHVCIIRIDENKANPYFVYYQLFIKKELLLSMSAVGATRKALTKSMLESIDIELPSRIRQDNIVKIMQNIQYKISVNKIINDYLMKLCETYYSNLKSKSDKFILLKDIAEVCYGKDHKSLSDGKYPVYGSGGIMRYAERPLYSDGESVLIPRKGTLTNIMFVSEPFWSVDTMFYTKMKDKSFSKYLYFFMKEQDMVNLNSGSAVPSMTTDILNSMEIPYSSLQDIEKFNNDIQPFFDLISSNQKNNTVLTNIRDTLLPKLMSGEIDVSKLELNS